MEDDKCLVYWLQLKKKELHQLGYVNIELNDLRQYLFDFLWRKGVPQLYIECVEAIIDVTANNIFDYKTLAIQKQPQMKISEIDLNNLS